MHRCTAILLKSNHLGISKCYITITKKSDNLKLETIISFSIYVTFRVFFFIYAPFYISLFMYITFYISPHGCLSLYVSLCVFPSVYVVFYIYPFLFIPNPCISPFVYMHIFFLYISFLCVSLRICFFL